MNRYDEFYHQPIIRFNVNMSFIGITLSFIYFDWSRTFAGIIIGGFLFAIFEYFTHRYMRHHDVITELKKVHLRHRDPEDIQHMFFLNKVVWMYCLILTILPWWAVQDLSICTAMLTGALLYSLYAQWRHFVAHRQITPGTAWGRRMKSRHLWHHEENEKLYFGVSQPYIDYLLGNGGKETRSPHNNKNVNHLK